MLPPIVRRFIAGESTSEALDHVADLNDRTIGGILNLLGEHYTHRRSATADTRAYCRLASDIARADLRACISVKPTQLGLAIDEEFFRDNLGVLVDYAAERDVFAWLDMEDYGTTDATLDAYTVHARENESIGICLQANLRRTGDDLERVADLPGKVRLVKGAYDPPPEVAYQSRDQVDEMMREHLRFMFREFDDGVALGSHDPELVTLAADLHEQYGTPYEVQMLMGVRDNAQSDLARHHDLWQYAPYGERWLSYFYRRMTENAGNLRFILRALLPA